MCIISELTRKSKTYKNDFYKKKIYPVKRKEPKSINVNRVKIVQIKPL